MRRPVFWGHRLLANASRNVRWGIGIIVTALYVYAFYTFLVAPFTLRWRGIFGEADYPAGYSIRGIDISHHQGVIDWDKLRWARIGEEPISFVFMKATEGETLVDRQFSYNFSQAHDYGFVRGAYHFFAPSVPVQAQLAHFFKTVKLEPGDLPPVLDVEQKGDLSPEALRKAVLEWLHEAERHYGVVPILYTYYSFKKNYLNTPDFDKYPYWIAHYYVKKLNYDGEWKFWQHTDKGRLPGISGDVDLNLFNGSMYNLRMLEIPDTASVSQE